jgi:hypothetical protein
MTDIEHALVVGSLERVLDAGPAIAIAMRMRMPETATLGHETHVPKLLALLASAATEWPTTAPAIRAFGAAHEGLGVTASVYGQMGEAFVAALQSHSGPRLSADAASAWRQLYVEVANEMICGGAPG